MLATLSPSIVEGPEWVFEEKYDGIRAVAGRERGKGKIWSRMRGIQGPSRSSASP